MNALKIIFFRSIVLVNVLIMVTLVGCDSSLFDDSTNTAQHDGENLAVNLATPLALAFVPINELNAHVSLDGETPIPLEVNPDNTISGTINRVETGSHDILITYFVLEASLQVTLAEVQKNIDVTENGTTVVTINDSDLFRNFDDDGDGYTNLAEIRLGTLALNKLDTPGGESPLFVVSNGSFEKSGSTSYQIAHSLGSNVSGTSASTNYKLISEFID